MRNLILGISFIAAGIAVMIMVMRRYPRNRAFSDLPMITLSLLCIVIGVVMLLLEGGVIGNR